MSADILLVGPALDDPGGIANYYVTLLSRLGPNRNPTYEYLQIGRMGGAAGVSHYLRDPYRLLRHIRDSKPGVVVLNPSMNVRCFIRESIFAWLIKRCSHANLIVFWHGWDAEFAKTVEKYLTAIYRISFKKADTTLVLTSTAAETVQAWGQSYVVSETTMFSDEFLRPDAAPGSRRLSASVKVLFLSRIEQEKGVYQTIDAVCNLLRQNVPVELTIAGAGSELDNVMDYCRRLPTSLARSIHFAGYVRNAQKAELLAAHDLYCLPTSHGEGMPVSVLEAMAAGLPVITTGAGGLSDFFLDGVMGRVVQLDSVDDLTRNLKELIDDPLACLRMSDFNREYAFNQFSSSEVGGRFNAHCVELLPP